MEKECPGLWTGLLAALHTGEAEVRHDEMGDGWAGKAQPPQAPLGSTNPKPNLVAGI